LVASLAALFWQEPMVMICASKARFPMHWKFCSWMLKISKGPMPVQRPGCLIEALPRPKELEKAFRNYRYAGPIFVAPPWREIYHDDDDRTQDWLAAKATYVAVTAAWKKYGYDLVELPKASVEERVLFVKKRLA